MEPIRKYYASIKEPYKCYVGIAYDEPIRYERLDKEKNIALLYDLKITEKEAMQICRENDLLSPIYEDSFRGGCWFCPKQSLKQIEFLYDNYPELFNKLLEMEKDSHNTFKIDYSLKGLKERFEQKNRQLRIGDNQ